MQSVVYSYVHVLPSVRSRRPLETSDSGILDHNVEPLESLAPLRKRLGTLETREVQLPHLDTLETRRRLYLRRCYGAFGEVSAGDDETRRLEAREVERRVELLGRQRGTSRLEGRTYAESDVCSSNDDRSTSELGGRAFADAEELRLDECESHR